jgi:bifunctional DNA-binding transcriptional regulator/antitoxin component of YhaV-PrlF toxin-antitoxin module
MALTLARQVTFWSHAPIARDGRDGRREDAQSQSDCHFVWYFNGMKTTIDKAGRVIIPAPLRVRLGLVPGPVEIVIDGAGVRIEPITQNNLVQRDGRLVIAADGPALSADDIRELRLADQR